MIRVWKKSLNRCKNIENKYVENKCSIYSIKYGRNILLEIISYEKIANKIYALRR